MKSNEVSGKMFRGWVRQKAIKWLALVVTGFAATFAASAQSTSTNIISGTISSPGERDRFTFTLAADARFYFDSLTNVSSLQWSLSGPPGNLVANRSFVSSDAQSIGDPTVFLPAGDYSLTVQDPNAATDGYAFRLVNLAEATLLIPGTLVTNNLVPANKSDFYQFTAQAGDQYYFQRVARVNLPNTWWRLLDPYGNQVFSQGFTDVGSPASPVMLSAAGTYTVLLEGYIGDTGSGSYAFNVVPEGHVTIPPFTGTSFNPGDLISGAIATGTTNFYTFNLANPARVIFDTQTNSSSATWSLQGPSGTLVNQRSINNSDWANNFGPLNLPAGSYQLRIQNSGATTYPYVFRLIDLATAVPITPGTSVTNTLSPASATALYRFPVTSGQTYYFNYLASGGLPNSYWRLVDPYNNVLFSASLVSDQGPITLNTSGTYTLLNEGYWGDTGTGTNVFNVQSVNNGLSALTLGTPVAGAVTSPGQSQVYTFTLGTPAHLFFDCQTNSTQLRWSLTGPGGTLVNGAGLSGDNNLGVVAAGNYTLTVWGVGDTVNSYRFNLMDLASAAGLTPGTPINDTLTPATAAKSYQFTVGTAGKYYFNYLSSSGLPNASWQLLDPEGNGVFNIGLGSDSGPYNLLAGTYTILVQGYINEAGNGSYSFNVIPVTDGSQSLTLGSPVAGAITTPGQSQVYTFNLPVTTRLYFDSQTNSSQLHWTLVGPAGVVVNNAGFGSDNNMGAVLPGNYTLTVFANNHVLNNYLFNLVDLGTAAPLTPGTPVNDTLSPATAAKAYQFTLATAGKYFFNYLTASGLPNASWLLLDPQGATVFNVGLGSDAGPYNLLGGTYTLLVLGYINETGSGSFNFNVVPVTDGGQALTTGALVNGNITVPGQAQRYTFTLAAPAFYYFDSLTNNNQVHWSLDGPTGNLVNNRSFTGSDAQSTGSPVLSLPAGNYTLTVSANGDNTSGYAFRFFDLAAAAAITPGTPVNDTLNPANSTVAYTFNVAAQGKYYFNNLTSTGLNNPYWRLIAPDGSVVFGTALTSDQGPLLLTRTGSYTLLVEGYYADTGSGTYSFNVQPFSDGTQAFTLGSTVSGSISSPGQIQQYTFALGSAARLYFDSLVNNSQFHWSLDGPTGNLVNGRSFTGSEGQYVSTPVLALPAGNYTLSVTAVADTTGAFQFRLLDLATATSLTPGTPVGGTLNPANSTLAYQFSGSAGDQFLFSFLNSSGMPSAYWRLVDPYNNILFGRSFNSDAGTYSLVATGTYLVLIEGYVGDAGTGTFGFNVSFQANVPPGTLTGTALSQGVVTSGSLATSSSTNSYTFQLASAASLYFDALTSGSFQWSLFGPAGFVVSNRSFQGSDSLDFNNPLLMLPAGNYQLNVFGATGNYSFRLLNAASATSYTTGTVVNGTLTPANSTVLYQFSGNAGEQYYFDGQPTSGFSYQPYVRIYGPLGNIIQQVSANSDIDTFTLPQTGTYTVTVEGRIYDANASGNYGFDLVPESYPTTPLTIGSTINGTIPKFGQRNLYTFTLPAAKTLYFDSLTNANFYWRLDNVAGQVVNWEAFTSSDGIDNSNPALVLGAGSYTLTVAYNNFAGTGNYSFRLLDFANATPFTPGTVVNGTLTPASSTVFYSFSGTAGTQYYFDGQPTSGFTSQPYVRIYGPLGNIVQGVYVNGDLDTFTLPQTGTYTLTVEGRVYDTDVTGNFAFNLVPENYPTSVLTIGSTINGTIPKFGQRNLYTFTLPVAKTLYFDSLTNANFYWRLDAPWGQVVNWLSFAGSDGIDSSNPAVPLAAGTYTLSVAYNNFAGTGDYSFRLLDFSNATPITSGTVVNGTLTPANSTFFYTFSGTAGDRYYFDGQASSGFSSQPYVRIYAPLGNIVQAAFVNADLDTFTLPQTGTYTMTVEGRVSDTNASGNYSFNLIPENYPTTALTIGSTVNGTIPKFGQRNLYTFTLPAPKTLYFDSLTNANFYWRLDASWGQVVNWEAFNGSDGIDMSNPALALAAGTYTLTVAYNNFAGTGNYSFRLLDFANATPFTPGAVVNGTLTPANSTVFYTFTGTAGDRYYFDGQPASAFTYNPYMRIYSPSGNIVQSAAVISDLDTFTLPLTGTYTLTVEGRVYDSNTSGNFAFNLVPNPVLPPTPIFSGGTSPDLTVTGVSVSPASGLQSGGVATVHWSDSNTGGSPTSGSFTDRITIRNASNTVLVDTFLPYNEGDVGNGPIAGGGSRTRQLGVTLPDGPASVGNLQVTVTVDAQNTIAESNEGNNATSAGFNVALAPYPDLQVTSVSATPATGWLPGSVVTINWRLTNTGTAPTTTNWVDYVVVRNTNTLQTIFNGSKAYSPGDVGSGSIAAGDFRDRSLAFTMPTDASAYGAFAVTVTADGANQVYELNGSGTAESNNATTSTIVSAPDLIPGGVTVTAVSGAIQSGNTIKISWSEQNQGTVDTGSSFSDRVTVVNLGTSETLLNTTVFYNPATSGNGPISPGTSRPLSTTFQLPDGPRGAGTLQVTVAADTFSQLPEANAAGTGESNNSVITTATSALSAYPDLQIANLSVQPATLASGTNVTILWQDNNTGTAIASGNWYDRVTVVNTNTGATLLDTQVYYSSATLGALTNGTARSRSYSFILPNGTAAVGHLMFTITADTFNGIFEYNPGGTAESNNSASLVVGSSIAPYPDLQVVNLAVLPAQLASGTNVTVNWQDSNTGAAPTVGSWYDHVLVVNTNIGVTLLDAAVLYDPNVLGPLTNGTVRDRSFSFSLPYTTNGAGNLQFAVAADTFNSIFEYNSGGTGESNNSNSLVRASSLTPLPDLIVGSITSPAGAVTDQSINVQFTVANQGVLDANGNIGERVFISTTPTPGTGTLTAVTAFNGPLSANTGTNLTATLQTPSVPGTYWIIVQVDAADNVQELSEDNNFRVSSTPLTVAPAYSAALVVDLHSALANTPIPMHGLATLGVTGQPAAFSPVRIHVLVRGTDRTYDVLTAADGTFTNVFYPLPNEAGDYQVAAAFPGVTNPQVEDSFTLIGMNVSPVGLLVVTEGASVTNTTQVSNLSDIPLNSLSVTVVTNQPNLAVSASLSANSLGAFGAANLKLIITAQDASVYQSSVVLKVTSSEGASATLVVTVQVQSLVPKLVTAPASLTGAMIRGTQTPYAFTLSNSGGAPTGPLQVDLPSAPWLSLASVNPMPPLAPGSNTVVTLLLNPAADLPLATYPGNLVIRSSNTALSVAYSFVATSTGKGNLMLSAEDEYTYYVAGSPRVTNATVVLSDAISGTPVITNYTGADGTILFTNLTEAYYLLDVSATNHSSFRQTALVSAGNTTNVVAFLPRETIHYTFTVVPTTVQDTYTFTVNSTFETQVPIPVVTVSPSTVDLTQYPENEFQVLLTISNQGLIDVEDARLVMPTSPDVQLTPLVSDLGKLKANTSVTVPVVVKRTPASGLVKGKDGGAVNALTSSSCVLGANVAWNYLCGPNRLDRETAMYWINAAGCGLSDLLGPVLHPVNDTPVIPPDILNSPAYQWLAYVYATLGVPQPPPLYHFACNATAPAVFYSDNSGQGRHSVSAVSSDGLHALADNSVCAKVNLSLDHQAVLTRDAFKATLEIDNDVSSVLTNIRLNLTIVDGNGALVNTNFAVTPVQLSSISAADGTGTLAGNTVGTATWTLIPTLDASPTNGSTIYLVGGTLSYTQDGTDLSVPLGPSPIQVFPQPELAVRYFHDRDVYSDDPFTPQIEPSLPYSLAVQVNNVGYGDAKALTITGGKPQVVDNVKGLLVNFSLLGTQLENQQVTPALDVNFGQIGAGTNKIARWLFTSSLQGSFTNFSASFKQVDQFGNPRLSLVRNVEIHELTHIVDANGPYEDGRMDFLVNDQPDPDFIPDTIYLSDGSTNVVGAVTNAVVTGVLSAGNLSVVANGVAPAGWSYFRFQDPGQGQYRLTKVQRADNSEVPFGTNVWTTDRSFVGGDKVPIHTNLVHLLDYNSAGTYTLFYTQIPSTNDTTAPTSVVAALPASSAPNFTVSWSGADGAGGSGVATYNVYVSVNGGGFTPWIQNTALTSAIYSGVANNQYAFVSQATDVTGNQEALRTVADTQTTTSVPANTAPVLSAISAQSVAEGGLFTLSPSATDSDVPAQTLTWSLLPGAPSSALISPTTGQIAWQTQLSDGGTTASFTVKVTDSGTPGLSATQTFTVQVIHTNHPPVINSPGPLVTVNEQSPLSLQLTANDPDAGDTLTWSWASTVPTGLNFNPATGLVTWTPTEAQGPGLYVAKVVVHDNGTPSLSATNTFTIQVNEVNQAPAISQIANQNAIVESPLYMTVTATDPDVPANTLSFSLASGAPPNATINATSGLFYMLPSKAQAGASNYITVVVTDNGVPPLSDSTTFAVVVGQYVDAIVGSTTVAAGDPGSVPLTIDASTPVTNVTFILDASAAGLTNFSLPAPVAPLASATLQKISPTRIQITFQTQPGQSISGLETVSTLNFSSVAGTPSSFIRLHPSAVSATSTNGTAVARALMTDGTVTVANSQPLLLARINGNSRDVTLFGRSGLSYQLQYARGLTPPIQWQDWKRIPMTNVSQVLQAIDSGGSNIFFRAYEFVADPPLLDATYEANHTVTLTLYGQAGTGYTLQSKPGVGTAGSWGVSLNYTPTNSFYFLRNVVPSNASTFYRISKP